MNVVRHLPWGRRGRPPRADTPRLRRGVVCAPAVRAVSMMLAVGVSGGIARAEPPRLVALDRVQIGEQTIVLAGIVAEEACAADAIRMVSAGLAGRVSRFIPLRDATPPVGFVALDNGRTVNELLLETGCPSFDAAGLPAGNAYVKGMTRAAARGRPGPDNGPAVAGRPEVRPAVTTAPLAQPAWGGPPAGAATGGWSIVSRWTGSGELVTEAMDLPAGEIQIVTLAVPNGRPASQITVVVREVGGTDLGTTESGPLTSKFMKTTAIRLERPSRIQIAISGTDVFWGVWTQIPR